MKKKWRESAFLRRVASTNLLSGPFPSNTMGAMYEWVGGAKGSVQEEALGSGWGRGKAAHEREQQGQGKSRRAKMQHAACWRQKVWRGKAHEKKLVTHGESNTQWSVENHMRRRGEKHMHSQGVLK